MIKQNSINTCSTNTLMNPVQCSFSTINLYCSLKSSEMHTGLFTNAVHNGLFKLKISIFQKEISILKKGSFQFETIIATTNILTVVNCSNCSQD